MNGTTPLAALALLVASVSSLAASPYKARPAGDVLDETGRISQSTRQRLEVEAASIRQAGLGEVGVVVIGSTDGADHRRFATDLLNHWRLGGERKAGVLFFVALDDRAAELVLGNGVDADEDVRRSDAVMENRIVPAFKRGDPQAALLEGMKGIRDLLVKSAINDHGGAHAAAAEVPAEPAVEHLDFTIPPMKRGVWVLNLDDAVPAALVTEFNALADDVFAQGKGKLYLVGYRRDRTRVMPEVMAAKFRKDLGIGDAFLIVYSLDPSDVALRVPANLSSPYLTQLLEVDRSDLISELHGGDPKDSVMRTAKRFEELALSGRPPEEPVLQAAANAAERNAMPLGIGGLGLLGGGAFGLKRYLRFRPRNCEKCQRPRVLLSDQADDVHLDAGQKAEEGYKSVDYDVWWCGACRDPLVLRYGAIFTSKAKCRGCNYVTLASNSTTLVAATYDHGGTVEVNEHCGHCNYRNRYTRSTPRLQRSTTSSSSSSSRSSSSFSSGRGSSGRW